MSPHNSIPLLLSLTGFCQYSLVSLGGKATVFAHPARVKINNLNV